MDLVDAVGAVRRPPARPGRPPELVEQALSRSGLTRQELLQRLQAQGATAAVDTTAPPGRVALPVAPRVILPFDPGRRAAVPAAAVADALAADGMFGADFFRLDPGVFAPPAFGPVPPDYVLGPGDQVSVDVFGEVEFRLERVVDRDGGIILPKGGKVNCAGRTLEQVTRAVREKLAGSYSGIDPSGEGGTTFVDVGLGALRAIRVFVVGEARQPGAYELTSLSTAFTALYAAGGPAPRAACGASRCCAATRSWPRSTSTATCWRAAAATTPSCATATRC
ncbi:MAG: polysaccharide biosynthesis/export family protein [bacterium]|nr:polysaccharide biosynthesis/export family protein [bacterium]